MRKRHQKGSLTKVNGRWVAQWRQDGQRRKRRLGLIAVMTSTDGARARPQGLKPSGNEPGVVAPGSC